MNKVLIKIDVSTIVRNLKSGPKFYFDYVPAKVTCYNCKKKTDCANLAFDSKYDKRGNKLKSSETICPHCGQWDCCELVFEEIEDLEDFDIEGVL